MFRDYFRCIVLETLNLCNVKVLNSELCQDNIDYFVIKFREMVIKY